jgi:TonB family protein
MRVLIASAALAAAFVLMPAAARHAPAWSQDFSITNPDEPADGSRRDLMRQLQAWWDVHAFYPRHASRNDEDGTVGIHLTILRDGRIFSVEVTTSSESESLDAAARKTFSGAVVRPFPAGVAETGLDISLHYILAHRHDQPVPADYKPVPPKAPFTIANDPVKSPILETMLLKSCTGTIVLNGLRNNASRGVFYDSKLVFFRQPDGTPWVEFYEVSHKSLSPVVQVGKLVTWTGPTSGSGLQAGGNRLNHYTAWLGADNKLNGCISTDNSRRLTGDCENANGTLNYSCEAELVPQIEWDARYAIPPSPPVDPP